MMQEPEVHTHRASALSDLRVMLEQERSQNVRRADQLTGVLKGMTIYANLLAGRYNKLKSDLEARSKEDEESACLAGLVEELEELHRQMREGMEAQANENLMHQGRLEGMQRCLDMLAQYQAIENARSEGVDPVSRPDLKAVEAQAG